MQSYLLDRKFYVKINDTKSEIRNITSGVPQGSPLGPLLFSIFINDLPYFINNDEITPLLFADDLKLLHISNKNKYSSLPMQSALDSLYLWSHNNFLPLNTEKTYIFSLETKNSLETFTLNDKILNNLNEVKDLGIIFDNKLDFRGHINSIISKSYAKIFHLFKYIRTKNLKIWCNAFKMYVRPILEYCTEIWSPYQKLLINKIEKVQKLYTRIVYKKCGLPYTNYENRLTAFNLQSLENRRKALQLTTLHKLVFNKFDFDIFKIIDFSQRRSRKHDYQIRVKHRNKKSANSFIHRNSNNWNNLDAGMVRVWDDKYFCKLLLNS